MTRCRMNRNPSPRQRQRAPCGFTLVELLVALAVLAILWAVAWPGYGGILQRAQRNDARLALLRIQQLQESHYATHLRYATRLGETPDADTLAAAVHSHGGYYALSLRTSEDGQRYTAIARAAPDGRQRRDLDCQQLAIDEAGRQRSADVLGNWTDHDPHRCWR